LIGRCDAGPAIDDKENQRCGFHGDAGLLENPDGNLAVFAWNQAAGVYNLVGASMPMEGSVNAIARDSRFIRYDGAPLADQTIEECGFADVRPSNDSNERQ